MERGNKVIEIKNIRNVNLIVNCTPVGMYPEINMTPLEDVNMINSTCKS